MSDADQNAEPAPQPQKSKWTNLGKPVVWLWVAVVGGLAGAITGGVTNALQPSVEEEVTQFLEQNTPPVDIVYTKQKPLGRMWVPTDKLTDSEISSLARLRPEQQQSKIYELGGFAYAGSAVEIQLTGVKSEKVRIVDIKHTSECEPLEDASLVLLESESGLGSAGPIVGLSVDAENVGQPLQQVEYVPDPTSETNFREVAQPYFVNTQVQLEKDEMMTFNIAVSASEEKCRTNLEVVVHDSTGDHTIPVLPKGQELVVGPLVEPEAANVTRAYLGGRMCDGLVEANKAITIELVPYPPCDRSNPASTPGPTEIPGAQFTIPP